MTIVYSADDPVSSRWSGLGRPLTAFEFNYNNYQFDTRLTAQEARVIPAGIASFAINGAGTEMTLTLTDSSVLGPIAIPLGTLAGLSDVNVAEGIGIDGFYLTWSNATSKWVATALPSVGVPTGGATGQVMEKSSGTDFATTWGYKLPTGGAQHQVLMKNSSTTQDASWAELDALHVSFSPSSASGLTSTTVAAALEEIEANIGGAGVALSGLSDVNITEGSGLDGYFLQWNSATSKWVAAAASSNLSGLADVNVTEGAPIDGYFLKWDNGTSRWIAAASSATLAGLTDVSVTEGSGINGQFLKWNNATSKWIASTVALSGLSDVNVTEGSGINGYFLKWDNATGKWVASLTGATAVSFSGLSDVNVTEGSGIDGYTIKWDNGTSKWITTALGTIASFNETTAAQYQANTAGKALSTDKVWSAAGLVALTDAATIAVDMSTFINASVTLGGNRTLGNPSNTKNCQTGVIKIAQDGTGSRTLAYSSNWKFAGGSAPVLTTTASAVDLLFYEVISSTFIYATLVKDVK